MRQRSPGRFSQKVNFAYFEAFKDAYVSKFLVGQTLCTQVLGASDVSGKVSCS